MSPPPRSTPRSPSAAALAAALLLVAGLSGTVLGPGLAQPDRAHGDSQAQGANDSREDPNRSREGQARDDGSQDRGAGPGEAGPRGRGPADPVEVREVPGGFATRAPPGSPRPEVAVDAANGSARVERPDVAPLSLALDTLVEFVDEDGDGAYDVGEPVAERHQLRSTPHRIVPDEANATRTVVYDLGNGSRLELAFDVGTDHGERVGTKLDVVLEGYDFQPGTRVALGSRVQVDGGLEHATREGRPTIAGERGEEVAYLSWTPTVRVDGEDRSVASTVHVDAAEPTDSAVVYWAYPQGERIVHDPTLGVRDAIREVAGRGTAFALGLAASLAVLGVGYAARARWGP